MQSKTIPIPNVKHEVIDHLMRYRLSTFDAITRLPSFQSIDRKTVKRQLRAVQQDGRVAEATLYAARPYYYLTSRNNVADSDQSSKQPLGPLSEQAKIRAYAMLAFCCLNGRPRTKLLPNEIRPVIDDLPDSGLPTNYYKVHGDPTSYGRALIDAGNRGRWDRIIRRLCEDVRTHSDYASARQLIDHEQFEWAILTALPQKAARLQEALGDTRELQGALVRVCVIPELLNLIAPSPR